MFKVKNLTRENLPTNKGDGTTLLLAPYEEKLMEEVDANKMLEIYGERVISVYPEDVEVEVPVKIIKKKVEIKKKGK